jgi:NAD(P)H-dependent FMN reductase
MSRSVIPLAMLIATTPQAPRGNEISEWLSGVVRERDDYKVDVVRLAERPLPTSPIGDVAQEVLEAGADLSARLDQAEAFVIVTPEYNHSYPAMLKIVIDWNYTQWEAKPVAIVSYGGRGGGLRAVEHLRQVFAELHAVVIRDGMSFHLGRDVFDESGEPVDAPAYVASANRMLDQLSWWSEALTRGRAERPYVRFAGG